MVTDGLGRQSEAETVDLEAKPVLRLVAFDLDDTLYSEFDFAVSGYKAAVGSLNLCDADSEMAVAAMSEALSAGNNPFDALVAFLSGSHPEMAAPDVKGLVEIYRNHMPDISLTDGVGAALRRLRESGAVLCLVTDGRSVTQRNKIAALGLEEFFEPEDIYISEETGFDKVSPNSFINIMQRHPGMSGYEYIGDNPAKDFIHPNLLGWATACVLGSGRNIHPQPRVPEPHGAMFYVRSVAEGIEAGMPFGYGIM